RMHQAGQNVSLAPAPLGKLRGANTGVRKLNRHAAFYQLVGALGQPNLTHPASTDLFQQAIGSADAPFGGVQKSLCRFLDKAAKIIVGRKVARKQSFHLAANGGIGWMLSEVAGLLLFVEIRQLTEQIFYF